MMISCVSDFPLLLSVTVALTRTMLFPGMAWQWYGTHMLRWDVDGNVRYNDMELTDRDGSRWHCWIWTCWTRREGCWSAQASQSWAGSASPVECGFQNLSLSTSTRMQIQYQSARLNWKICCIRCYHLCRCCWLRRCCLLCCFHWLPCRCLPCCCCCCCCLFSLVWSHCRVCYDLYWTWIDPDFWHRRVEGRKAEVLADQKQLIS